MYSTGFFGHRSEREVLLLDVVCFAPCVELGLVEGVIVNWQIAAIGLLGLIA